MTLDAATERRVADTFGVPVEQVRRDHLISHLLAAISARQSGDVIFYGGTALARTHLPEGRLSEDIDLIATGPRAAIAETLDRTLLRSTRSSHGPARWDPSLTAVSATQSASLVTGTLRVRVQLLGHDHYPPWPIETRQLHQRYPDAPDATLTVPTLAAFAAWKTAAWHDRHAARDLWDLWALARIGAITPEAADLFVRLAFGYRPQDSMFNKAPTERQWRADLSGQTRLDGVTAEQALSEVRQVWRQATS